MKNINSIITRLIPTLNNIFNTNGKNVEAIILYGSEARGTATEESDIDIAVIIEHYTEEMHQQMIDAVVDLELEYNKVISVLLINNTQFNVWKNVSPFYKNIKKDGILREKTPSFNIKVSIIRCFRIASLRWS